MNQEQYDLVFSGQLAPGFELGRVKSNIQALFKIDDEKVNILFSGKPITLKKGLALDVATKYRVAMKKAGARADLILNANQVSEPKPAAKVKPQTEQTPKPSHTDSPRVGQADISQGAAAIQTSLGAQADVADTPREEISAPDFGIAEMGGDLLNLEEKRVFTDANVDTSKLSVAPQGGNLVDESELYHPQALVVDIPDIDVAPAGSDVLNDSERKKVKPVEVDTSSLSVVEAGGNLSPPSSKPPSAPDVSHIHLSD